MAEYRSQRNLENGKAEHSSGGGTQPAPASGAGAPGAAPQQGRAAELTGSGSAERSRSETTGWNPERGGAQGSPGGGRYHSAAAERVQSGERFGRPEAWRGGRDAGEDAGRGLGAGHGSGGFQGGAHGAEGGGYGAEGGFDADRYERAQFRGSGTRELYEDRGQYYGAGDTLMGMGSGREALGVGRGMERGLDRDRDLRMDRDRMDRDRMDRDRDLRMDRGMDLDREHGRGRDALGRDEDQRSERWNMGEGRLGMAGRAEHLARDAGWDAGVDRHADRAHRSYDDRLDRGERMHFEASRGEGARRDEGWRSAGRGVGLDRDRELHLDRDRDLRGDRGRGMDLDRDRDLRLERDRDRGPGERRPLLDGGRHPRPEERHLRHEGPLRRDEGELETDHGRGARMGRLGRLFEQARMGIMGGPGTARGPGMHGGHPGATSAGRTAGGRWSREPLTAREVMTKNPRAVRPDQPLSDAAQVMRDESVGIVPVVDERGRLQGVLTDRDIVCRAFTEGKNPVTLRVRDAMTDDVECVMPDESLHSIVELMGRKQIRRVPVVEKDDRLVGIIAMADVANRADYDEELQDALERISARRTFWKHL